MDSPHDTARSGGLPHSEIRGSAGARPSPRLFAACHVLHRLSVPRHPPDALLVLRPRPAPSTRPSRVQRSDVRVRCQKASPPATRPPLCLSDLRSLSPTSELMRRAPPRRCSRIGSTYPCPGPTSSRKMMAGPASRSRLASRCHKIRGQRPDDRPHDPPRPFSVTTRGPDARRRARDFCSLLSVLCHLSLPTPVLVGLGRLERPTSRLSGVRSDQLSYRPSQRSEIRCQMSEGRAPACVAEPSS
jgi:hypothetical protein